MGVFLRWGILGILSVAALLYAYNASKRLAQAQERKPAASAPAAAEEEEESTEALPDQATPAAPLSPHCEVELLVARRAQELRQQSEPLDRVLRMQEIAWQEPAERRERLQQVATRWYEQAEPLGADALKTAVLRDCEPPAP